MACALRHLWERVKGLGRQDRGQATLEYALVASYGVLVLIAAAKALEVAVLDFYYDVVSLVCLPIP